VRDICYFPIKFVFPRPLRVYPQQRIRVLVWYSETANRSGEDTLRGLSTQTGRSTKTTLETLHHYRTTFCTVREGSQSLCSEWRRCSRARDMRTRQGDCAWVDWKSGGLSTGRGRASNRSVLARWNKNMLRCRHWVSRSRCYQWRSFLRFLWRGALQEGRKSRDWGR